MFRNSSHIRETISMAYQSYKGLPQLANLSTVEEAAKSEWSVEESVTRLKVIHYQLKRLREIFTARITSEPIYELKNAFSYHAYLCSEHVSAIRKRVSEMREPPLGLELVPHTGWKQYFDEILAAPTTEALVTGLYFSAIPILLKDLQQLFDDAHPLADAPTVRLARFAFIEMSDVEEFGDQALECLIDDEQQAALDPWCSMLAACVRAAKNSNDTLPEPIHSAEPFQFDPVPKRDERFNDPFNAGVNPEVFLYDERFSARDKTLMMYYKRIREIDVPEMMASILHEMPDREWDFHYEMSRQLWDESRHAMMGEVGFAMLGVDWTKIPINFTWSLNLNTQLTPQERHGVLYFIEQGLMPKTGKRYEWEVGTASGDPLSKLFQDFDWADEVLHSQIGRRWYVPQFESLNAAMDYGDECWSKVLSHWSDYREQGKTEHHNWWPKIYTSACEHWGTEPDPAALAFCETYEDVRADLKDISASG